jgi:hypothetical protein
MVHMTNPMKGKTWYPLILEVFVSFLFWVCQNSQKIVVLISNLYLVLLSSMPFVHFKCIGERVFRWVIEHAFHSKVLELGTTTLFDFDFINFFKYSVLLVTNLINFSTRYSRGFKWSFKKVCRRDSRGWEIRLWYNRGHEDSFEV